MLRILAFAAIGIACPVSESADPPPVAQKTANAVKQLREVGQQLQQAGLSEESRAALALADRIEQSIARRLDDKHKQAQRLEVELARLRQEIAALEGRNESAAKVTLQLLEVDSDEIEGLAAKWNLQVEARCKSPTLGIAQQSAIAGEIEQLRINGRAKLVAEPTLVTLDGRPAEVHSGGEFPVRVPDGSERGMIAFRPFGTTVHILPQRLEDDRWSLDINLEHSVRDFSNQVRSGDLLIPGLQSRSVNTQCELGSGEVLVHALSDSGNRRDDVNGDDKRTHLVLLTSVEEVSNPDEFPKPVIVD